MKGAERGRLIKNFREVERIETFWGIVKVSIKYFQPDFNYDVEILANTVRYRGYFYGYPAVVYGVCYLLYKRSGMRMKNGFCDGY
ncbi:MAG: hypothetical protein HFG76_01375 [Hungatella sp.]|nr:hypothetical protein [Hungatella sp.]